MTAPTISVVVCTTPGREASLQRTLAGLRHQRTSGFEVVVVGSGFDHGGAPEGLPDDVVACGVAERNLSAARNAGVRAAAGALVAFIDDDAVPEPTWLDVLAGSFSDPEVAAAGGPVLDHTGVALQARYSLVNALGEARVQFEGGNPSALRASPGSDWIVYPIGTSAMFRRDILAAIGGFDEEFEYYLDEADVCRRLVDRGWVVQALDEGHVLHGFLPSVLRSADRVLTDRFSVLKNRCYFALRHGIERHGFVGLMDDLGRFADHHRADCRFHVDGGRLDRDGPARLEEQIDRGYAAGQAAAARGPRLRDPEWFAAPATVRPFATVRRADALHVALLAPEWAPARLNGISRVIVNLAVGLADRGHDVRVLTPAVGDESLDFEDGVWVHRVPAIVAEQALPDGLAVPEHLVPQTLAYAASLARVHDRWPVDVVQVPNWDSPGIGVMAAGGHRTVLGLYTPLRQLVATDPRIPANDRVIGELEALELVSFRCATAVLACGEPIVDDVADAYGVDLRSRPLGLVPHGIEDAAPDRVRASGDPAVRILFVGRLEPRKGVDELLAAAPAILEAQPMVELVLVGDATGSTPRGSTYPAEWAASAGSDRDRVRFAGPVDDDELARYYADADIVVVPSRFESFGLTVLEAMRAGVPVVVTATGEMQHIVAEAACGAVVPPLEPGALAAALIRLAGDAGERRRLGAAGRARFAARYTRERMAADVEAFYRTICDRHERGTGIVSAADESAVTVAEDLSPLLCCPICHGALDVAAAITVAGRPYEGVATCPGCAVTAAVIADGRWDFHRRGEGGATVGTVDLPALGERRVDPSAPELVATGDWRRHGDLLETDRAGAYLELDAVCAGATVLLLRHPHSGMVELRCDGEVLACIDLFEPGGSVILPYRLCPPGEPRRHRLQVAVTGERHPAALGSQVLVREIVLHAPLAPADGFGPRRPLLRGNPYSPVITRHLDQAAPGGWILECGGGERRRCVPRHVNFEYLAFESADVLGDGHALPFCDDVFDLVVSQAVLEHLYHPFRAVEEMVRVARPGGLIVAEAAFMQPLHAVPSHYFNVTPWGMAELFRGCETVESGWFGSLSGTVAWLMDAAGLPEHLSPEVLEPVRAAFRSFDQVIGHDDLRAVASGVYQVVRKPVAGQR